MDGAAISTNKSAGRRWSTLLQPSKVNCELTLGAAPKQLVFFVVSHLSTRVFFRGIRGSYHQKGQILDPVGPFWGEAPQTFRQQSWVLQGSSRGATGALKEPKPMASSPWRRFCDLVRSWRRRFGNPKFHSSKRRLSLFDFFPIWKPRVFCCVNKNPRAEKKWRIPKFLSLYYYCIPPKSIWQSYFFFVNAQIRSVPGAGNLQEATLSVAPSPQQGSWQDGLSGPPFEGGWSWISMIFHGWLSP